MNRHGWRYCCYLLLCGVVLAGCRSSSRDDALRNAHLPLANLPVAQKPAAHQGVTGTAGIGTAGTGAAGSGLAHQSAPSQLAAAPSAQAGVRGSAPPAREWPVTTASLQEPNQELPQPSMIDGLAPDPASPLGTETLPPAARQTLALRDVIISVQSSYPLLVSAIQQRTVAGGDLLATQGEFDLQAKMYGIAAPEGYYRNYRNGVSLDQPLFSGGYLYGGYKIGDGYFEPWYKERETNEGGEFAIGVGTPLLKGLRHR